MSEIIDVPMSKQRDIATVTTEIRTITNQAQRLILEYAIEIGRRLTEAKTMVPHGEWGRYLREEVEFSQSTANNFMRIFEEYGADQGCLFGAEAKSQTIGNLPYTKALKLLALPADEREQFAQENHVEDISVRELDKLIKERDEALKAKAAAEAQAQAAEKKADSASAAEKKAKDEAKDAKAALKAARDNPEIPAAMVDKLRAEAETKAAEAAGKKYQDSIRAAEQRAAAAEASATSAQTKLDAATKQLGLSSPEAAEFRVYFNHVQEDINRICGCLLKIKTANPELGDKLRRAVLALADKVKADVSQIK